MTLVGTSGVLCNFELEGLDEEGVQGVLDFDCNGVVDG